MRIPFLLAWVLLAVSLAGCTVSNGPGGQSASADGSLSYNGASTGTHSSTPFECDGDGSVNVSYNLGGGDIKVNVKDNSGITVWTKSYSGPGQGAESRDASGTEGMWVVEAIRSGGSAGGFSGQYAISVSC